MGLLTPPAIHFQPPAQQNQLTRKSTNENHVVKIQAGSVLLYRSSGNLLRTICHGAAGAVVQGEEVHVTMTNGQVRIYNLSGNLKRTI